MVAVGGLMVVITTHILQLFIISPFLGKGVFFSVEKSFTLLENGTLCSNPIGKFKEIRGSAQSIFYLLVLYYWELMVLCITGDWWYCVLPGIVKVPLYFLHCESLNLLPDEPDTLPCERPKSQINFFTDLSSQCYRWKVIIIILYMFYYLVLMISYL